MVSGLILPKLLLALPSLRSRRRLPLLLTAPSPRRPRLQPLRRALPPEERQTPAHQAPAHQGPPSAPAMGQRLRLGDQNKPHQCRRVTRLASQVRGRSGWAGRRRVGGRGWPTERAPQGCSEGQQTKNMVPCLFYSPIPSMASWQRERGGGHRAHKPSALAHAAACSVVFYRRPPPPLRCAPRARQLAPAASASRSTIPRTRHPAGEPRSAVRLSLRYSIPDTPPLSMPS